VERVVRRRAIAAAGVPEVEDGAPDCVAGMGLALVLGLACAGRRAPPQLGPVDDCDRCVGDGAVCTSVYDQTWCLPSCADDCDCPNGTLCEPSNDGTVKMCITFAGDMACTSCADDQLCLWGDAIDLVACADVCDPSRAECAAGLLCQPIGVGRPAVCVDPVVAADVNLAAVNRANNIGRVCGDECGACPEGTACIKASDAIGGSLPSVDGGTFRQVFRCVEQCVVDADCAEYSTCEQVNPDTGFDALCAPSDPAWDYP
jgi:hypothetical protein